jgi:hypothetical protein
MESPFCLRNTYRPRTPRALRVKKTDKGFVYNVGRMLLNLVLILRNNVGGAFYPPLTGQGRWLDKDWGFFTRARHNSSSFAGRFSSSRFS